MQTASRLRKLLFWTGVIAVLPVFAGQVRDFTLPPVSWAVQPPEADGDLSDWNESLFTRLESVPASEAALRAGIASAPGPAASIALMRDEASLHVALRAEPTGNGPTPAFATAVLTFLAETDPAVRIDLLARAVSGTTSGAPGHFEARIPLSELPDLVRVPRIDVALSWEGMGPDTLRTRPEAERRDRIHQSLSALTASPRFAANAYLPNPEQWGTLVFGAGAEALVPVDTPLVRDATRAPAPRLDRPVAIDGDLADWSGLPSFPFALLPGSADPSFSGTLAFAFDDDALYVAATLRHPDGIPLNSAPASTGAGYGGGDALQLRFSDGGPDSASLCAWPDTATGRLALTIDGAAPERRDLLAQGAELAIRGMPDGKDAGPAVAYEIRLPWTVLPLRRPSAGPEDAERPVWRATAQPWWCAGSPAFHFVSALRLEPEPRLAAPYTMPRDGHVSIGVFHADGRLVRQLAVGAWREKGVQAEPWDGLDMHGEPVAPGDYRIRGIVRDKIAWDYIGTLGNPGSPPWPTADGRGDWLSDEAPPQGVATDGENVYVAAPGSENGFAVMKLGPDGRKIWSVGEPRFFPRCVSLSYLDGRLYALYSGPELDDTKTGRLLANGLHAVGRAILVCYDAATGDRAAFSRTDPDTVIARWPYREESTSLPTLVREDGFRPARYIGQPRYWCTGSGETTSAIGLAATPERIAVSRLYENKLEFFHPDTAGKTGEMPLERPAGLHARPDGTLLAISGERVVRIAPDNAVTPVVTAGLDAPVALTEAPDGTILVSDWGRAMQVKRFSPDGRALGAVGAPGGRPFVGPWKEDAMLLPHGLAVTGQGALYVAEADMHPKRLSVWDAATGAFRRDFLGPFPYSTSTFFWTVPGEPEGRLHFGGNVWDFDFRTGASRILGTDLRRMDDRAPFTPSAANAISINSGTTFEKDGRTYLALGGDVNSIAIFRIEPDTPPVPCAAVGCVQRLRTDRDGTGALTWDSDIGRHLYPDARPAFFRGHAGDNFAWSDRNGDGLAQEEEMTWHPSLTRGEPFGANGNEQAEFHIDWSQACDPSGVIYVGGFCRDAECIYRLAPVEWLPTGPVYDVARTTILHRFPSPGHCLAGLFADRAGNIHATLTSSSRHSAMQKPESRDAAVSFTPDGTVRWRIPAAEDLTENSFEASAFCGEFDVPGIGSVLGSWIWWWNCRPYLVSSDGLLVGTFFSDAKLGPDALWGESLTFYHQTADGSLYVINGGNNAPHFFRLRGLENASRFESAFSVAADDLARSQTPADGAGAAPEPRDPIVIAPRPDPASVREISLADPLSPSRSAVIGLARIGDDLQLRAGVRTAHGGFHQAGRDVRTLFLAGDCIDLFLETDPDAPADRREAVPGDRRLLLSALGGQPVAVLYEPRTDPPAESPVQLMAARFDRITVLENAEVSIEAAPDGYLLSARIPLAALGLSADDTRDLRGDVGIVFSDGVSGRERRLCHYNDDTGMLSDLTTEATLRPDRWGPVFRPARDNLFADEPWIVELERHGADAEVAPASFPEVTILVTNACVFPPDAFTAPDYEDFRRAANGGSGAPHVSLCRAFAVTGGETLLPRIRYCASGLRREIREPGPDRGYCCATLRLHFHGEDGREIRHVPFVRIEEDSTDWRTCAGVSERISADGLVHVPAGARSGILSVKFTCLSPTPAPRIDLGLAELIPIQP
ncbi:MAG: hypothetical protein ACOX5G_01555 [Kiritimatiellia bacterium]|jgi:hypothetical protein